MGVQEKPDIIDIIEKRDYSGMAMSEECQNKDYLNLLWNGSQWKEIRKTTKENLDGGFVGGYDCQRAGGRSVVGHRGMAIGFRKATEDVMIPNIYKLKLNPWHYNSEEPRTTEAVAARWQYTEPCG